MKKRALALLLAMFLLVSLVTACSQDTSSSSQSASQSTQSGGGSSAEDEEPVTLSFVTIANTLNVADNSPVQQYLEEKYNVKLVPVRIASENLLEQLGLMLATDEFPDIIPRTDFINDLKKQDAIGAVNRDWVAKYAPNHYAKLEELYANYGVDGWEMFARDGEYYGMPITYLGGVTMGYGTIWRQDLLDSLGYSEPPKSIAECDEVFAAYKAANPGSYVMSARGKDAHYQLFASVFNAFGYNPKQAVYYNGDITRTEIMPGTRQALEKLAEWYKLGYIDPEYITNDSATYDGMFYSGKLLMYEWGYIDNTVRYDAETPTYYEQFSVDLGQPEATYTYTPGIADDNGTYRWQGNRPYAAPTMFSASMAADEKKMAKYLEMLDGITYTLEDSLFVIYGEEGERWEYDANGVPQYVEELFSSTEEREKYGNNNAYYFGFIDGSVGSGPFASIFGNPKQLEASNAVRNKYLDHFELYFSAAVLPAPEDVQNSYTDDIETMYAEAFDSIISGKKDITYFDDFVERWLNAGGQAYLDAMNELNLKFFA